MGLTNNQIKLFGISNSCPLKVSHVNCPFNEIRKKSAKEQLREIRYLSEAEASSLIEYHNYCLFYRELGDFKSLRNLKVNKAKIIELLAG